MKDKYKFYFGENNIPVNYVIKGIDREKLKNDLLYRAKIKHRMNVKTAIFGELHHPYCPGMKLGFTKEMQIEINFINYGEA